MNEKPKKIPFEEFKKIYSTVPRFCIDLVIQKENSIILTKRSIDPDKGKWHFPGGTVLLGEKIEDTIKRVAEEETGLSVQVKELIGIMEFSHKSPHGHTISAAYLTVPMGGEMKGSEQGEEIKSFSNIPENMIAEHKDFLLSKGILFFAE